MNHLVLMVGFNIYQFLKYTKKKRLNEIKVGVNYSKHSKDDAIF